VHTLITALGDIGVFLVGMIIMTDGLMARLYQLISKHSLDFRQQLAEEDKVLSGARFRGLITNAYPIK
jgi:hypothetical protein